MKDDRDHGVGPKGEGEGGWQGLGGRESGSRENQQKTSGKLEAAHGFRPPGLPHHLMKLHLQNMAHEGCGLWIEWKGKSIV